MKKRFMTGIMAAAMTMSMMFGANGALVANAEELTQIENPADVNYGEAISDEDKALLKGMFDADYYASLNSDVVDAIKEKLGDNYTEEAYKDLLFVHFCTCGMYEGRSLSEDFNVSVFASANADLQAALGTDVLAYYKYAATHDLEAEGRTITTLKEAAEAGITVANITNPNMKITPAGYYCAESLGIKSLQVLSYKVSGVYTVNRAVNHDQTTNNVDVEVIIADTSNSSSGESAWNSIRNAEKQLLMDTVDKYYAGSLNATNTSFKFYIVIDQNAEFAVYNSEGIRNFTEAEPISSTSNYSADNVDVNSKSFKELEVSYGDTKFGPYEDGRKAIEVDYFGASTTDIGDDEYTYGVWYTEEEFIGNDGVGYNCVYQHVEGYSDGENSSIPGFGQVIKVNDAIMVDRDTTYVTYAEVISGLDADDTDGTDDSTNNTSTTNDTTSNTSDDNNISGDSNTSGDGNTSGDSNTSGDGNTSGDSNTSGDGNTSGDDNQQNQND